jgi:hypothetical protein
MSGHTLAETIRRKAPGCSVLFVSGYSAREAHGSWHDNAASAFLQKRFHPRRAGQKSPRAARRRALRLDDICRVGIAPRSVWTSRRLCAQTGGGMRALAFSPMLHELLMYTVRVRFAHAGAGAVDPAVPVGDVAAGAVSTCAS